MASRNPLFRFFDALSPTVVRILRIFAAAGLLFLVAWFVDITEAVNQLKQTDWRWLVPACILVQFQVVLSAVRWKITANRLGQPLTARRAISEYYLATFANLSLPGGITGDAARVYRNRQPRALDISVHSVMIERLAGQIALLVVSIVGWMAWPVIMQGGVPEFGGRVLGVALVLILLVVLSIILIIRFAPDWMTRFVVNFGPALYCAWLADRQWIVQSVLSLAIVLTYVLVFLLSSYAVQVPLPLTAMVTIVPLVLLSMVIPLSIGGWGIREASAAVLWPLAGLSSEAGIATSVVYALVSLIACLPGLLFMSIRPDRVLTRKPEHIDRK
ncbi:MAG: lysylphosphatidylglycerol synthase transmembrane domain-containing protein [Granulosicoccus sp.]